MSESEKPYEGWAIVELMGHRRLGGRVSQAEQYGVAMLRVDVPGDDGETIATQFCGGSSIYALTPCSEAAAQAVAKSNRVEPVGRWELPALAAPKGRQIEIRCAGCRDVIEVWAGTLSALCSDCLDQNGPIAQTETVRVADEDLRSW